MLLTDIEDQKRAENALRANERNLILIINTIPMLPWSTRPDGYVDFLNQRWLDFTGLSAKQAGGLGWSVRCIPTMRTSLWNTGKRPWHPASG